MTKIHYRRWYILLTLISAFVLAASFYFQYIKGYEPCPLCIMQRISVLGLLMLCLMGAMLNTLKKAKKIAFWQGIFSLIGLYFVGRQLWLQHAPVGTTPACMPELDILLHYFPWKEVVKTLLWGSSTCGDVRWVWLGLSMPAWAGVYFLFMFITALAFYCILKREINLTEIK